MNEDTRAAEYRYANDPAFNCLVKSLEQAGHTAHDLEQAAIVLRSRVRAGRAIDEFGVDDTALKAGLDAAHKTMARYTRMCKCEGAEPVVKNGFFRCPTCGGARADEVTALSCGHLASEMVRNQIDGNSGIDCPTCTKACQEWDAANATHGRMLAPGVESEWPTTEKGDIVTLPAGSTYTQLAPPDPDAAHRLMVLYIDERDMPDFLAGKIRVTNLPTDVKVTGMCHDFHRRAMGLRIQSKEFPVAQRGSELRTFEAKIESTCEHDWMDITTRAHGPDLHYFICSRCKAAKQEAALPNSTIETLAHKLGVPWRDMARQRAEEQEMVQRQAELQAMINLTANEPPIVEQRTPHEIVNPADMKFTYDGPMMTVTVGPAMQPLPCGCRFGKPHSHHCPLVKERHARDGECMQDAKGNFIDPARVTSGEPPAHRISFDTFCMSKLAHVFHAPHTKAQFNAILAVTSAFDARRLIAVPLDRGQGKTTLANAAAFWASQLSNGRVLGLASDKYRADSRANLSRAWAIEPTKWERLRWRSIQESPRGIRINNGRPTFVVIDDPMTREVHNSPTKRAELIRTLTRDVPELGGPGVALAGVLFADPDLCRELVDLGPWTLGDPIAGEILFQVQAVDRIEAAHAAGAITDAEADQMLNRGAASAQPCTCGGTTDAHHYPCPHWKA